jgi:flagellar biosynthesis protein FliR
MVAGLFVFARCAGFAFRAPGFSHPSVPAPLRAGFAATLAIAILASPHATFAGIDGWALIAGFVAEFLLGSVIGMTASLVYDAAYAGGRIVDDYVGMRAIAPSLALVAPSGFGRVWSLALTGGFFLSGAYRVALMGFAQSFTTIPVPAQLHAPGWSAYAGTFATAFVRVALQIAAPAVGLAFVAHIAIGAISRVVPRFGSFTLAFPLAFAAALIATAIALPVLTARAPAPLTFFHLP